MNSILIPLKKSRIILAALCALNTAFAMEEEYNSYSSELEYSSSEAPSLDSEDWPLPSLNSEHSSDVEDYPPIPRLQDEIHRIHRTKIQEFIEAGELDKALMISVATQEKELVADLIAQGAEVNSCWKIRDGIISPLLWATCEGYTEIVAMLLNADAIVDALNHQGYTPLIYASERGYLEIVSLLLEAGANVNHISSQVGTSALRQAAQQNHLAVAKLLLAAGAQVNAKTANSPLVTASSHGHTAMVKLLIEAGAEDDHENEDGATALIYAAHEGHAGVVEVLLKARANPNYQCSYGTNPLIGAAMEGHRDIVKMLLQFGAYNHIKIDQEPLENMAYDAGYKDIASLILEHQANSRKLITLEDEDNCEAIRALLAASPLVLNGPDIYGKTPLMRAARYNNFELCRIYLKAGALVDLEHARKGLTALDYAKDRKHQEIIELLTIYGEETLKNRICRKIMEADEAEQSKIFDGKLTETHLNVLPSFIELDVKYPNITEITHNEAFGYFYDMPARESK